MSLAKLFYLKETFRESVRRWRQACFRQRSNSSPVTHHASYLTSLASRFTLETLEPRLLLSASPTEVTAAQALEPAAITVPAGALPSLDVDLNGQADALSDGILIIRHLFGFTGNALTDGVVDPGGQRTDPTAIHNYLNSISSALDVDLNQQADALSDGIMIIRSLFGFSGAALTDGAIDSGGGRTDPSAIATFLDNMNPQRELVAPVMTAGLQQDTGLSASDAITFNPTITGTLADVNQIASFTAGVDLTPAGSFVDVLADLQTTGTFTLSTARMNQLAGGTLADGTHTLHLRATDARGNVAMLDRTFTLDTLAPLSPTFDLALTSDTGTVGDQQTTVGFVTLRGQTDPTTSIQLVGPGTSTLSNGSGIFQLPDQALAVGANPFTFRATDVAGNSSEFTRILMRLAATPQADVVLTWNQTMLEAIRLDATAPPIASRGMAMVSLAMYDTINAIEGTSGYYVSLPAQAGTNADAAAAAAAHRVLSYLYPGQQTFLDSQLAVSLALVPNGQGKTDGITLGQSIAEAIIAIRATDGWNDFVDYVPGTQPGDWQQTAPMYDVALLPQWADLTPFALTSPNQFRPVGPPALDSAAYAAALNEVKALGSATGSTRTADQTQIARFWADGGGTYTPPGHWDQIAQQIALQQGNSLSANARLFAQLNVALADAGITAWNTKYADAFWRPITAIQQADLDGNALTTADPTWSSFLITPPFPEYISGHSTFSGAAAEILTSVFGANVGFTTTSLGLPGVTRTFTSFEQAAQEAGKSRIYGGIHFEFSNQDGLTAGKALADFVLNRFTVTTDSQGPTILLNQQSGTVTKTNLTITGQVLDNLSGVAALLAKLDNGAFAPVTISPTGTFTIPTALALDSTADGSHTVTFQATDLANNVSTLPFTFILDTQAPVIALTSPLDNALLTATTRLTGTADATGSKLVELCYKFDNGTLVPVSFDPTTGSFDTSLDLSKLAVGAHTLSLRAQDAAGNVTTITRNVSLATPIPLTITAVTPQPGSSDVGSTFRPQVFFSRPINPGSLNSNNFFANDSTGTKLAATIVPSQDGTFAWLFFTTPMPGASTITIHVDGTSILAAGDGQALDADGNGTAGGVFTSTFSTVSLVPLAGTTLSGKVLDPGPDLKMMTFDDIRVGADGILHTNDDVFLNPIAGATVYILGLESQVVVTDAQGNFSFSAVPSGTIKLAVDGRTATNAPDGFYFPEMVMDLEIEIGQANTVMGTMGTREAKAANLTRPEVYLPRLQTSILQTVSDTETTMISVDAEAAPNLTAQQRQYLTLEVQPGSLIGPDGQPLTSGQVGISTVPPELVRDMLPPGLLQHTFDITIQAPDAATFNAPLQMTFPNVFNAAPGTKLNFLSFDHTTGRLVVEGTATVSADGFSVTTDPDTGITKPGWHGVTPPGSDSDGDTPDDLDSDERGGNRGLPEGIKKKDTIPQKQIDDLSDDTFNVLDDIVDVWDLLGAPDPVITSGNGDIHGGSNQPGTDLSSEARARETSDSRHYTGDAVDIRGNNVSDDVLRQLATELQERLGPNYDVEAEFFPNNPTRDHIHIEYDPSSFSPQTHLLLFQATLEAPPPPSFIVGNDFALLTSSNGFELRLKTSQDGLLNAFLPSRELIEVSLYDPESNHFVFSEVFTGESGSPTKVFNQTYKDWLPFFDENGDGQADGDTYSVGRTLYFSAGSGTDFDNDGLPDDAEHIIGTLRNASDSDNDGISDLAEIKQGLDPLGGRLFPTGVIASLPLQGEAKELVLEGSIANAQQQIAYVATGSFGLGIVDASQFQKPVILSQLDLPGDATDVSVDSQLGIAVVASNAGGLHFIDISNPTAPTLTRTIATTPNQVEVFDGFAYVTVGSALRSYNLLTGELVQSVAVSTGSLVGLAREGNVLYTTDRANVLRATSIVAGALTPRGSLTIPLGFGDTAGKIFVANGIAYIGAEGSFNGGFVTADVSNPDTITLLSGVDGAGIAGKRIVANGSGIGVSVGRPGGGANVIDVVSLTDPANTNNFLTRFTLPADPFSVAIGAGIAFVADGTGGLQVVNYRAFDNQGIAPTVSITSPVIDFDPGTPGIQVTEGSSISIRVNATDDVQVRNVEMLVNGVVVSNDVSFPFDLSAIALGGTSSATTTTAQVRATDTGGNASLSNILTFNLVPDTFAPALTGSNISGGLVHDQSFKVIEVQFSEALDASTVTAQNFTLVGPGGLVVTPSLVALVGGATRVQLSYLLFDVGTNQLVIKSSAVTDRAGNVLGTQDIVIPFEIVSQIVPPVKPLSPFGGLVYAQQLFGHVSGPSGVETFTMTLDAGQVLTVGVMPDSATLRPQVEVVNALGQVLASADSPAVETGVSVQAVPIPVAGTYTIRVRSLAGAGDFKGVLYLNAVMETELFGGPSNDTIATATTLGGSSIALQGAADRLAAVGYATGGDDFYRIDLTEGQVAFFTLSDTSFGVRPLTFDLRDASGAQLTVGVPEATNVGVNQSIRAFRAPQAGAYYLRVNGTQFGSSLDGLPGYVLVATRGAAFDLEPNDIAIQSEAILLTGQALGSVGTRNFPIFDFSVNDPEDNFTVSVNEGDVLEITTTTPGVGIGEPGNGLDPFLQLIDPIFGIVWSDDNSAPDGRNAVISATAPTTGLYRLRVSPIGTGGDYTIRVTGATGPVALTSSVVSSALTTKGTEASLTLGFSSQILLTTVQPGDVTINGLAASALAVVDATTLRFTASGVAAAGSYTVVLGAGVMQDIRETPNAAFSRTFAGDTTAPVVVASSVSPLTLVAPNEPGVFTPFVVTVTFSEDLDQTVLDVQDMQLKSGDADFSFFITATTFTYSPVTDQLQIEFPMVLSEGQLQELHLVSGLTGLRDLAGNPLDGSPGFPLPSGQVDSRTDDFVVEFGVGPATPAFASVDRRDTPGSLMFGSQDVVSVFGAVDEVDTWTVPLEAGQVLAVGLFPSSTIQGRLEVFDPNGVKIGSITGSGIGKNGVLVDLPVVIAGTYRVEVTSLAGVGPYHVGFALNASVDVEDVALLAGHNNTVATAQSIQGSAVSLQGAADRLAVFGDFETTVDVDVYAFQLTAGQPTTFVLDAGMATSVGPQIELLDQAGSLIATRTAQSDGSVRIDDFVAPQTGTFFARLSSGFDATFYNFIVVRGATFEAPLPDGAAQNISTAARVLGIIDTVPSGAGGGIRVAVLGGAGATDLVAQLNDDTFFNFDAVVVGQADIDTVTELHNFDVVVIGDPASRAQLQGAVAQALQNWWFSGEGAIVGTGGLFTAAGPGAGGTLFGLDFIIPVDLNGGVFQAAGDSTLTITATAHEITQGLTNFVIPGPIEVPLGDVDQTASFAPAKVLGTAFERPAVTVMSNSNSNARSAYVAPTYFDVAATGLRSGSSDRLLEQTVAWASGIDFFDSYSVQANVGDQLVIKTTTPLDGPRLPQNLLDPRIELLNPASTLVASNDNGAPDGKNALLNYTVPVGGAGTYTIRIRGAGAGEYTVAVTGATGVASASTAAGVDLSIASASASSPSFDGSLAYVQQSWVKDFVAPTADVTSDDEELLIQLA